MNIGILSSIIQQTHITEERKKISSLKDGSLYKYSSFISHRNNSEVIRTPLYGIIHSVAWLSENQQTTRLLLD